MNKAKALKILSYSVATIIALFILSIALCYFIFLHEYSVASYKNDYGDKIVISRTVYWEIRPNYYYKAYKNGKLVKSRYIYDTDESEEFNFITSPNSRIITVIQKSRPHILLAIHDFTTNQFWVSGEEHAAGDKLLEQFKTFYPDENHELGQ